MTTRVTKDEDPMGVARVLGLPMADEPPKYIITGSYQGGEREQVDTAKDLQEARYLLGEYRLAFGADWSLSYRRVRKYDDV